MPARHRRPKGRAFIEAIFTGTKLAHSGGPVRRSLSYIEANASLAAVFTEATARHWTVMQVGAHLHFSRHFLPARRVIGVDASGTLIFAP